MVHLQHTVVVLATFVSTTLAQTCATINPSFTPTWESGYSGRVFMNGLTRPRGLVFDSSNNLLVVESGGAGVRWVQLKDNGGTDVCVGTSKQLINESGVSSRGDSFFRRHEKQPTRATVDPAVSSITVSTSPPTGRPSLSHPKRPSGATLITLPLVPWALARRSLRV